MPHSAPLQSDFTGGEISPYAQGRVDKDFYKRSLATCFNAIPMIQGPWTRRPGTKYVATVGTGGTLQRLIPFAPAFGSNCMLILQAGATSVARYQNYALIVGAFNYAGTVTPYTTQELPQVRYVQNGRYLYLFHTNHPPIYLGDPTGVGYPTVSGALNFFDGPYLQSNNDGNGFAITSTTFALSTHTPGSGVTLTASGVAGINGGAGFQASDVNRSLRINPSYTGAGTGTWAWAFIQSVTDTTHVTILLEGPDPGAITATQAWALGVMAGVSGSYPGYGILHEGRLFLGGYGLYPQRFDASSVSHDLTQDPTNVWMAPTEYVNGRVDDSNALDFTLFSQDSQKNVWGIADEKGILMGTTGDEWTVRPNTLSGGITPTNVDAKTPTSFGSNPNIAPCKVGKGVVFAQRSALKVREMFFAFDINGYRAPDRTLWAEHIAGQSGIVEMAWQREPQSIVWCRRADGTLAGLTHQEVDGEIMTGWHRHALGLNPTGGSPNTASIVGIAVLPSLDGSRDELYMLVNRLSSTPLQTIQTLEVMQPVANQYVSDANQWFLDCATRITFGSPTAHISGLSAYIGMTVSVWADGALSGQYLVNGGGTITLNQAATTVLIGFDYNSDGQMLRAIMGAADGTAVGKLRRTHRVGFLLQQTLDLKLGPSFSALTQISFRTQDTPPGVAQPSFSGTKLETIDMDTDFDNMVCWRANGGAPCTVLAVCPRLEVQDAD